jgi:hypothetical protein
MVPALYTLSVIVSVYIYVGSWRVPPHPSVLT